MAYGVEILIGEGHGQQEAEKYSVSSKIFLGSLLPIVNSKSRPHPKRIKVKINKVEYIQYSYFKLSAILRLDRMAIIHSATMGPLFATTKELVNT